MFTLNQSMLLQKRSESLNQKNSTGGVVQSTGQEHKHTQASKKKASRDACRQHYGGSRSSRRHHQWRRLPRRSATAGQSTAATSDEETDAAPEVGLGAGASAAKATPAKADTATAATTAARNILEEAMTIWKLANRDLPALAFELSS